MTTYALHMLSDDWKDIEQLFFFYVHKDLMDNLDIVSIAKEFIQNIHERIIYFTEQILILIQWLIFYMLLLYRIYGLVILLLQDFAPPPHPPPTF